MAKRTTQNTRTWQTFPVGSKVAWRESVIFGGTLHIGEVVSVTILGNGYPQTVVNFSTYKGQQEWAVEALVTPDRYEVAPSYWAV